ncbi:MAG: histidine kinase [Pseudomonadales bacterium]|nr:histidine kinase [Pseudomonadales bacterium]
MNALVDQRAPLSQGKLFWLLQLAGWTGWMIAFGLRDAVWDQPAIFYLTLCLEAGAGFLLTCCLRLVYRKVGRAIRAWGARATAVLVASAVAALIWQPIKNYSQIEQLSEFEDLYHFGASAYFVGVLSYSYAVFLGWSGLYFSLKLYLRLGEERRSRLLAEALSVDAQLKMLRYQINPHFLFNTLNAINSLLLVDEAARARVMIQRLSEFLRYSLEGDAAAKVTLEEELTSVRAYLEIESVRFEDRLTIELNIEAGLASCMVPSLILQPLVENAVKHGITQSEEPGTVLVSASRAENDLILMVSDTGPGFAVDGNSASESGLGMKNTEQRLALQYGDQFVLARRARQGGGAEVMIKIPMSAEGTVP